MARWLQNAPANERREERPFTPDPLPDLLVFHKRALPQNAVDAAQLTANWIAAARRQLSSTPLEVRARALRHALGFGPPLPVSAPPPAVPTNRRRQVTVLVSGIDAELEKEMRSARFIVTNVEFTPFDAQEAAKIEHFDTYNRTAASQRVADIVDALRATPNAVFVGVGDAALAGLLALAVETDRRAILEVGDFDVSNDAVLIDRLYMPGLRRAGDLSTAAVLAGERALIHNAGAGFTLDGAHVQREKLTAKEIIGLLKAETK